MNYTLNRYPSQKVTDKEKSKVEEGNSVPTWVIQNAEYFGSYYGTYTELIKEMQDLINLEKGQIDLADLSYVENPFNTKDETLKRYPAKLRNYNIIQPIIDRLLGEHRDRPDDIQVIGTNTDRQSEMDKAWKAHKDAILAQMTINELNSLGLDTGEETQEVPEDLETERNKFQQTWQDSRAQDDQDMFDWIMRDQELSDKWMKAYYYWRVCGRYVTRKGVFRDDVDYNVIDPTRAIFIGMDDNSRFFEDSQAAIVEYNWNPSSILDKFGDNLSDDDKKKLVDFETNRLGGRHNDFNNLIRSGDSTFHKEEGHTMRVQHLVWKTLKDKRILHFFSELGGVQKREVESDYILNTSSGDLKIETEWETVWWETWRIPSYIGSSANSGKSQLDTIYLDWGEGLVQRTQLNNSNHCKIPYNGTYRGYNYDSIKSDVKIGINYQKLYNIFHYRFELTLAKNKDKVMLFPLGLIPNKKGWNTDRFMHQLHAFSIAFFDETADKALAALQAIKEIDMSLGKYMQDMWGFMQSIKQEYWDAVGFNRQRYGQVQASDLKGTTEQAIFRSHLASLDDISIFNSGIERDADGLIDYSKVAWIDGKQSKFTNPRGRVVDLAISGIEHMETEYGIHSVNNAQVKERLDYLKQLIQPMLQNGLKSGVAADVLEENNYRKVRTLLKEADEIQQQFEQQQTQQVNESNERVAQLQAQTAQEDNATKIKVALINKEARIEAALLTAESFNAGAGDTDGDGVDQSQEIINRHNERMDAQRKNQDDHSIAREKNEIERQKVSASMAQKAIDLKIAQENKNKYDR